MSDTHPFPKRTSSQAIGAEGLVYFETIVRNVLGWEFRRTPQESDFGVDGYVDIVTREGYVTGRSLAVQVKTGESYFKQGSDGNWIYFGALKHVNYYIHVPCPVLLVLVDLDLKKAWWRLFEPYETEKAGAEWTLEIPKINLLSGEARNLLLAIAGGASDYLPHLEHFWLLREKIRETDLLAIQVSRFEVESLNIRPFEKVCERLSLDLDTLTHARGKLDFVFSGYDNDPRDVFEIPEVQKWVRAVFETIEVLPYLLYLGKMAQGICVAVFVFGEAKKVASRGKETFVQIYNLKEVGSFMNALFAKLNAVTDSRHLSEEYNEQASYRLSEKIKEVLRRNSG